MTTKSGYVVYRSEAGTPSTETYHERERNERFWRSLRKKIQAGARIRP